MATIIKGTPTNQAGEAVVLDGTGKLPAVDGSQLTNLPIPATAVTTKLVTDSTDIVLNDIASGYNNVGSSFSVNIPTNGIIRVLPTAVIRCDASEVPRAYFGIRIGSTNYWFGENYISFLGITQRPYLYESSGTSGYYNDIKGYTQGNGSTVLFGMGIGVMSVPTGTQTVQLVAARGTGAGSLRGTSVTTRCVLEFVSAS